MAFDTILPADSVEFCPHAEAYEIFACGTYQLDQSSEPSKDSTVSSDSPRKQKRLGKCIIFEAAREDRNEYQVVQEFALPAILDMKWRHSDQDHEPLLAIADAEGQITLHSWDIAHVAPHATNPIYTMRAVGSSLPLDGLVQSTIALVCHSPDNLWSPMQLTERLITSDHGSLVVSRSDGKISVLNPTESRVLAVSSSWHAHDYEPWIAAWNYWDTNVVFSGGDDLMLKGWDVRTLCEQPTFTNKRFRAGVTTIQSHPFVEHLIAVGSYDNTVRLFDVRNPLVALVEADVGGGAWRVKWHPQEARKADLLVACMHDGFKIVRFSHPLIGKHDTAVPSIDEDWKVVRRYDVHESLAYGVDWSHSPGIASGEDTHIASCSFYDHALHVWSG